MTYLIVSYAKPGRPFRASVIGPFANPENVAREIDRVLALAEQMGASDDIDVREAPGYVPGSPLAQALDALIPG